MRKKMVVGIALLLLVLRAHKLLIDTKLAYRSSMNKFKMVFRHEKGEIDA